MEKPEKILLLAIILQLILIVSMSAFKLENSVDTDQYKNIIVEESGSAA